jgi:type IV secretory pathway VirB3-like protein
LSLGINIAMRVFNGLVTLFVYVSLQNWLFAFVWVRAVAREPLSRGVSE